MPTDAVEAAAEALVFAHASTLSGPHSDGLRALICPSPRALPIKPQDTPRMKTGQGWKGPETSICRTKLWVDPVHGQLPSPVTQRMTSAVMRVGFETGAETPVKPAQILRQTFNRCLGDAPAVRVKQTGFSPSLLTQLTSTGVLRSATNNRPNLTLSKYLDSSGGVLSHFVRPKALAGGFGKTAQNHQQRQPSLNDPCKFKAQNSEAQTLFFGCKCPGVHSSLTPS